SCTSLSSSPFYSLSFSCHVYLRYLHSFPTRRSSDLIYLFFLVSFVLGTILVTVLSSLASYFSFVRYYEADPQNPAYGIFNLILRDRKSTRLNSSHVSISYAVFCLKKKK